MGKHNVLNSLGCIALCDYYGININDIKKGLISYKGAARRFEYKGEFNGAKVYDDYGHHPTEVEAVSNSILNKKYNKSYVIFEPHTYSRVKNHASDFAKSLINFDNIIIADIYAAREINEFNVSENDIINELEKLGKNAIHISDYEEIKREVDEEIMCFEHLITRENPEIYIAPNKSFYELDNKKENEDIKILKYTSLPFIKMPVAQ